MNELPKKLLRTEGGSREWEETTGPGLQMDSREWLTLGLQPLKLRSVSKEDMLS